MFVVINKTLITTTKINVKIVSAYKQFNYITYL